MFALLNNSILSVNNSKIFAGIIMIVINIGSRYIPLGFSKSQEEFLKSIGREVLIFAFVWMATHDIFTAIILTIFFSIVVEYLLNENSKFCIMPDKYKNISNLIDSDSDGIITDTEIKRAEEILRKAKIQEKKINQLNMMSYFQSNLAAIN
jgi:hypothetical protein